MKNRTLHGLAILTTGLLALTACGPSEEEQFLEGMGCEDGESAEECGERMADDMEAEWDQEDPDPFNMEERDFDHVTDGPVVLEVGETADIDQGPFEESGYHVGTMTLDEVEPVDTCESVADDANEPDEGRLVLATFSIDATHDEHDFELSESRFYTEDNESVNTDTTHAVNGVTHACQETFGWIDDIEAGETVERVLVFELPAVDSPIIYQGGLHDVTWDQRGAAEVADEESAAAVDFDSCEEAEARWEELIEEDLAGEEIDQEELDAMDEWFQGRDCW